MKYIKELKDGDTVREIYLCKIKRSAETRNGKAYDNLTLQDKTGTLDAKVWDPNSSGIADYDEKDFIEVFGELITYNNNPQLNIKQIRKAREGEYVVADYMPSTTRDVDAMYEELCKYIEKITNPHLRGLAVLYFIKDETFVKRFKGHSAAKAVHHSFQGGLLEHTLSVLQICNFFADQYPIINRDLLITAALFHDAGKTKELSSFPDNDYTDEGQLVGHIVIGVEMISDGIRVLDGFPEVLATELKHCVIAHHGELEYGSPKKPALVEAFALNFADISDARMQTLTELLHDKTDTKWHGFNRVLDSNYRKTSV